MTLHIWQLTQNLLVQSIEKVTNSCERPCGVGFAATTGADRDIAGASIADDLVPDRRLADAGHAVKDKRAWSVGDLVQKLSRGAQLVFASDD